MPRLGLKADWLPSAKVVMTPAAVLTRDREESAADGAALDLTIFVSCYNEEAWIVRTVQNLLDALAEVGGIEYEIIVIDDCSSDRSVEVIEDFLKAHPGQPLILRANQVNRGLAQNYIDAAFIGVGKYYRGFWGDDPHPRDSIEAVLRELGSADMLIPYYVSIEGKSLGRRLLSAAYTWLVNTISGFHLHYYNGLAVHPRQAVTRWHPVTHGFGFQADVICMLIDQGFSYKEIPVRDVHRKGSESAALTFRNLLSVVHTLADIAIRRASKLVNS